MAQADSLDKANPSSSPTIQVMPGPIGPMVVDTAKQPTIHDLGLADEITLAPANDGILRASAALQLGKGGWEFKLYNQLYTQTAYFDDQGIAQATRVRSSYASNILQVSYGLNSRINIGLDAWVQSVQLAAAGTSPLSILGFGNSLGDRTALTALGPRVRLVPFRGWNGLVQSTFLVPLAKDPEGRSNGKPYLATENFIWWTQAYQNFNLGRHLQLYAELGVYWNINRGLGNGHLDLPTTGILSGFLGKKASLMAMAQFWPQLGGTAFSAWWFQTGLGGKFALSESLMLEGMYSRFLAGRSSAGPAQTFNLGIRYVIW